MEKTPTRILLVEDNPGDALLLEEALRERKGFHLRLERSKKLSEALDRLERGDLDVILLDLFLPDSSGIETLVKVRKSFPQFPILVLTGLSDQKIATLALKEGAQDFLVKDHLDGELVERALRYSLERHNLLQKIQEDEERYFLIAQGSNDGLWDWDLRTNKIYFSPRWKFMLGYGENELGEEPEDWFGRIHPSDQERVRQELLDHLSSRTTHFSSEHRLRHKSGSYRWVLSRGQATYDPSLKATRVAGSLTDITTHKNLEHHLAHRAFHDPLTGLPNRRLFNDLLTRAFARASQGPEKLFAVLFLDLDRLKEVNDTLGHPCGDQLLEEFAARLKAAVRPKDMVARIGGDEFTVFLDDLKEEKEALGIADRILEAMREPFHLSDSMTHATVSIGVAFSNRDLHTPDQILQGADSAMYQAKTGGKNRYQVFEEKQAG